VDCEQQSVRQETSVERFDLMSKDLLVVQDAIGRVFTFGVQQDAHCLSTDFGSQDAFLDQDVSGQHVWLNVQASELRSCLLHYIACKKNSPENTSACILVPSSHRSRKGAWRALVRGWKVVLTLKPGDEVRIWQEGAFRTEKVKYPMQILYDPAIRPSLARLSDASLSMVFKGSAAGTSASFLLDTGASDNFVSLAFTKLMGVKVQPIENEVTLGTGDKVPLKGCCEIRVRLGDYQAQVPCFVSDLALDFQVILGNAWLKAHKAHFDFETGTVVLKKHNRRITLRSSKSSLQSAKQSTPGRIPKVLSAMQLKRAVKKGEKVLLCQLSEVKMDNLKVPENVQSLLTEFADVFPDELPSGLPPSRNVGHSIPTEIGAPPPFRPLYRLSPAETEEVRKTLSELLQRGYIEPSSSPYGAPVLFVSKKDGSLRMVQDYRFLNKITIKNRYPLPRIDDLLDKIGGSTHFSSIDLRSGYHQIRITDEDVPKTAFRTPFGHYQFKVLSFGLTNAPATFQRVMNDVFSQFVGNFMVVYLDDILIYSKSAEEHEAHLRKVLETLREHKFYANKKKCEFFRSEIPFLGHIVGKDGVKVDPVKVAAVRNWTVPTDVRSLRGFLGLANYFRRFVQGFSTLVTPLTNLTRHSVVWKWTDNCQRAFDSVKVALTNAPVLASPDFEKPFEVVSDASGFGIGAVLLQEGRPIAFESRKLSGAEQNYHTTDREMLGVVHALRTWRCYLEGVQFTVITDHCPNTFFATQTTLSRRQARWSEFLQRFTFDWCYRPGRTNVADPLSRYPVETACFTLLRTARMSVGKEGAHSGPVRTSRLGQPSGSYMSSEFTGLLSEFSRAYATDPWFQDQDNLSSLTNADGFWLLDDKVVVPDGESLRRQILSEFHDVPYRGHLGMTKTCELVGRQFWWPSLRKDSNDYVRDCEVCQRNKPAQFKGKGLLQPLPVPEWRWESVSMDFITQLPVSRQGNDAVVVFVDRLSKMVHFAATKTSVSAEEFARIFRHEVFRLHGIPAELVSDRDPRFTSKFWVELASLLGSKLKMSTAFHPQTDGQTERVNRVLEDMLRHYVSPVQDDWDELLDCAEFAVNNAWQESIKNTPFFLNFGQHPRTPIGRSAGTQVPAANDFVTRLETALSTAKLSLRAAQDRQKSFADQSRRDVVYGVGQKILLSTQNFRLANPGSRKLLPRWVGPFQILERIGQVAYKLDMPKNLKMHNVFHVSLLKPYRSDGRVQPPPPPIELENSLEFEVERLLDHRQVKRGRSKSLKKEFLVKWLGYGPEHNTWEPESNLTHCDEILTGYWKWVRESQQGVAETTTSGPRRSNRARRTH
jgi:transposase InsO family protein